MKPLAREATACQARQQQQPEETIRGRGGETGGCNRIKLSRELMLRLSTALGNQRLAPAASCSQDEQEQQEQEALAGAATWRLRRPVDRCASSQPDLGAARWPERRQVGSAPASGSGARVASEPLGGPWVGLVCSRASAGSAQAQQNKKEAAAQLATLLPPTQSSPVSIDATAVATDDGDGDDRPMNNCSTGEQVAKGAPSGSINSRHCRHYNKNSTTCMGANGSSSGSLIGIGCSGNNRSSSSRSSGQSHLFTGDRHRNRLLLKPPLVVSCARCAISPKRQLGPESSGFQRPDDDDDDDNTLTSSSSSCFRESGSLLRAVAAAEAATEVEVSPHRSAAAASGATARRRWKASRTHRVQVSGCFKPFTGSSRRRTGGKFRQAGENLPSQLGAGYRPEPRLKRVGLQQATGRADHQRRKPTKSCVISETRRRCQRELRLSGEPWKILGPRGCSSGGSRRKLSTSVGGSEFEEGKKSIWTTTTTSQERNKLYCSDGDSKHEDDDEKETESSSSTSKKPSVIHEHQQHPSQALTQIVCSSNGRPSERVSQIINLSSCYAKQHKQQQHQHQHQKSNQASRETSKPEVGSRPKTKTKKHRKSLQELEAEPLAALPAAATATTKTTNCDTSKCDSLKAPEVAADAANGGKFCKLTVRAKWGSKTQLWGSLSKGLLILWPMLMLSMWFGAFWNPDQRAVLQVSGLQVPFGGSGSGGSGVSDELSRAVLATMSTQSPNARGSGSGSGLDEQLATANANSIGSNKTALQAMDGESSKQFHLPGQVHTTMDIPPELQEQPDVFERLLQFGRIFIMGAIIVGDICGNSLVILSVCRHSKLRVTTNWFVVSLACADILVALFAMTFNASVIISGRWLFKPWVCDFWNSCDVLASTASILHLCCISIDRYIAIMRPLDYPMKITTRRVVYALCGVWISSALLSYIPIFTGIYTTAEHIQWLQDNPDQCEFVVNRVYAIVSSSVSFWIPCCIMVFTYYRIYREATRQEKFIYKAQSMMPAPIVNHHHHSNNNNYQSNKNNRSKQRRSKSVAVPGSTGGGASARHRAACQQHHLKPANSGSTTIATTDLNSSGSIQAISGQADKQQQQQHQQQQLLLPATDAQTGRASSMVQLGEAEPLATSGQPSGQPATDGSVNNNNSGSRAMVAFDEKPNKNDGGGGGGDDDEDDEDPVDDSNSGQSTPTKRSISKMKREHKAAKTLGIIMGVFILCWLPFFSWYTPQHICGHACDGIVPRGAVTILFWIGYFNSTLNPIIYAYFNHEFRDAFKKTLQWLFCCCQDLKCLRVNRPNDNQHYNCTYRSTQEIGLVSNS